MWKKKHNIENNSNELYLSRWNVKTIDLNILALIAKAEFVTQLFRRFERLL